MYSLDYPAPESINLHTLLSSTSLDVYIPTLTTTI